MKAYEILNELIKNSNCYNAETTVDKIIIGNPNKELNKVLVTWIAGMDVVEEAIKGGYDGIITHEPTFYMHRNEIDSINSLEDGDYMKESALKKIKIVEQHDLVIIRVHDMWDKWPEIGMRDTWARFLGFGQPVARHKNGFQCRYDIEPVTVEELGKRVAAKTAEVGEPLVQVIGDLDKIVSKVCIGTGCSSTVPVGTEMGCDVNIIADDGSIFWRDIQNAVDMNYPIIRVNHGTSEEPGTVLMAQYLNDNIEGLTAVYYPHKPFYKMISAD